MNSHRLLRFIITLCVFSLITLHSAYSQDGAIRGFVYEQKTGEPVIFVNVYLLGTTYGSATDVNGFYTISKIGIDSPQENLLLWM